MKSFVYHPERESADGMFDQYYQNGKWNEDNVHYELAIRSQRVYCTTNTFEILVGRLNEKMESNISFNSRSYVVIGLFK